MIPPVSLAKAEISPVLLVPFILLLLLIATMPLAPGKIKHHWDRFYPYFSVGLGGLIVLYYLLVAPHGFAVVGQTLRDYVSFIVLIGSLFVVAVGIHIKVTSESSPVANVLFLMIGALVANIIGTTGASMVLIRPWIRMNRVHISPYHIVFFIFVVSNVGGALTPIGDPPLFLGYLRGVPFFWLLRHVIVQWFATIGAILAVFYLFDRRRIKHLRRKVQEEITTHGKTWRFDGGVNVLFLLVIVGAVFLPDRFFMREAMMLGAAFASWRLTPKTIHDENRFSFGPIKEVAVLFVGIFGTMMPVLEYVQLHGPSFGFDHPLHYYFGCGGLSAVLDNAPTYINFLQLAQSTAAAEAPSLYSAAGNDTIATTQILLQHRPLFVIGVSLGAVFFGAMTYIGNGPNFLVRAIAHDEGVRCPTFFGYIMKYSLPILLPILALVGWFFL